MNEELQSDLEHVKKAFRDGDALAVSEFLNRFPDFKKRINEPFGPFDLPAIACAKSREMLLVAAYVLPSRMSPHKRDVLS